MSIKQNCGKLLKLALMTVAAMVFSVGAMWAQNSKVSGKVTDKSGEPLAGVYVLVQGTRTGTSTDANGAYTLNAPSKGTLVFTYMGFNTATVAVNGRSSVNVVMEESATTLNDVVVVGFGTQKKVNLTGAVSSVDVGKTFNSKPITDVSKGLQGTVPGLTITFATNDLGATPSIKVRGTGSINGNNKPLVLLDGVEIPDLSFVNPDNIKSISVLKDAASASIYGTRAAFGVVLITSKDGSNMTDKVQITYSNNLSWNQPIALPKYCTSKKDVIAQLNHGIIAQKNVDGSDIEGFGMYYKDLIEPISEWFDKYKSQVNGEVWKYGRDYSYQGGTFYSYRVSDPNKETLKKFSFQQNHNLTITGSTGKTNYNIAYSYSKQDGQLKKASKQYVQRNNVNISTNTQLYKWLNVGTKLMYTEKMQKYPHGYASSDGAMRLLAYDMRFPTWFPYGISDGAMDDSGNYLNAKTASGEGLYFRQGNGFVAYEPTCTTTDEYLTIGANLKANLYKGLTLTAEYTRGKYNYEDRDIAYPCYIANWWNSYAPKAAYTTSDYLDNTWVKTSSNTFNAYLDYLYNLFEDHHFALKVGMNTEDYKYNSNYLYSQGIQNINIPTLNLTRDHNGKATVDEALRARSSAGFFARINYDYQGKYLLELNGRYDGSSLFKKGDKWAFFPSMSVGYRISEEKFWAPIKKYVSNLKLRASYGSIGNQNIASSTNFYPFMSLIDTYTNSNWVLTDGNFPTASTMPTIIGKSMTWEKIRTLDIGFDAGFLNNELTLAFDWYQRKNIGMLVDRNAVVDYGGFPNLPQENSGDLKTTGWEMQIDYNHAFNNNFSVYATFTLADATSKISKWNTSVGRLTDYYEGKKLGEIWGFETDRYWTSADDAATIKAWQGNLQKGGFVYSAGDIKYKDLDGDKNINTGDGTISKHGDLKRIGNTTPRFEYSLRMGASWKGIDAEILFQGVGKRDMYSYSSLFLPTAEGAQMNIFRKELDYWTEDNQNAKFPRPYFGNGVGSTLNGLPYGGRNNYYPQTKFLQNLAYLRLKNVTVGYTLPAKISQKAFIQKVRVYCSIENAITWDHIHGVMDPELTGGWNTASGIDSHYAGRAMPFNRQWSFGVQVTF